MPTNKIPIISRAAIVRQMLLSGAAQPEIAERLKCPPKTVSKIVLEIYRDLKERVGLDFQIQVAQQLARIEMVEAAAWEAWQASKHRKATERSKSTGGKDGERNHVKRRQEKYAGDPRFLKTILECIAQRSQLLGLDAVPDAGNVDDVPIVAVVVSSRGERQQIIDAQKFLTVNTVDGAVVDKGG